MDHPTIQPTHSGAAAGRIMSGAEEAVPAAEKNAPQQQGGDGEGGMLRVVVEGCCHGELDQVSERCPYVRSMRHPHKPR